MIRKLFYVSFFGLTFFSGKTLLADENSGFSSASLIQNHLTVQESVQSVNDLLRKTEYRVMYLNTFRDTTRLVMLSDSLLNYLKTNNPDSASLAELYYYAGVCDLLAEKHYKAYLSLAKCIDIKKKLVIIDEHFAKALFNASLANFNMGDYIRVIRYMQEYANLAAGRYGENSTETAQAYTTLAGASIECLDYESFEDYVFKGLAIVGRNDTALVGTGLCDFYSVLGVGYARKGDFAKARIYLEKAESIIEKDNLPPDKNYINLINSLAFTYGSLGLAGKEEKYLERGVDLAIKSNSFLAFNLINSYAIGLAKSGNTKKGSELILSVLKKARDVYGSDSRIYINILNDYAGYLVNHTKDNNQALSVYDILRKYLESHEGDLVMRTNVLSGYARALYLSGEKTEALKIISELLFGNREKVDVPGLYKNPSVDSVSVNRTSLRLLQLKYEILWNIYSGKDDLKVLQAAAETSDLIITLIEKIRIDITEEESRIVLGDNYRDSYLMAIRDFELCYRKTGDRRFMEKAFEFAEKSKVAGLLAATRQLKAVQFHIPQELADREKSLQREIGFYNFRISMENAKPDPDRTLISAWNGNLLKAVSARDSLVLTFERYYPGYFTLKYNTTATEMKEIPSIIGRNYNYINYVISDSLFYIFLINRKYEELLTFRTDSSFLKKLSDFRFLLSDPSQSQAARTKFNNYQEIGYDLYSILIAPVKKYLISDNLLISPDNILSYLPFEAFLSSKYTGTDIMYRKLDYLMNDYDISYAYSATFMNELADNKNLDNGRLIAFAPGYPPTLDIDSLLIERQADRLLLDLPFARQEAEYVSGITRGSLFINDKARESTFKDEAGKYRIIHLAMHTYVNDQNPMNSAMVFAQVKDSIEDGLLYTYEVYGIPLKAKMVVLSSCNTGTGVLSSGEGILSLARGFLYSGSHSVVMSLWKIEDRSGTDIIKMFYDNLKKGMSKSRALKKARYTYLKTASQLRSHPYFWSTLVIFGDNSHLYVPWKTIMVVGIILLLAVVFAWYYFWKRRYS